MLNLDFSTQLIIFIYLVISVGLYFLKPKIMFNNDGNMKKFGIGFDKTIFYYPYVIIILALVLYIIGESLTLKNDRII
jgi:hypothetical protein